jgi:ethanolamine utilization protein EutA
VTLRVGGRDVPAAALGLPSGHVHDHGPAHARPDGLDVAHSHDDPTTVGWLHDNVILRTVGIDIGSSTSHLLFGRVHLQRVTQGLSSRYAIVSRETTWWSEVLLTPYQRDGAIDAVGLEQFVSAAYRAAGVQPREVDAGVVILTGEALKRRNASAIGALFEDGTGRFVCAAAGHHREATMAAFGSGAATLSRSTGGVVLNVDIGGGTTKFALSADGEVVSTAAVAIGGRLASVDAARRVVSLAEPLTVVLEHLGRTLAVGDTLAPDLEAEIVAAQVGVLRAQILGRDADGLGASLLVTEPLERPVTPELLTFSGGVSEYVYGRQRGEFGDLGRPLGESLARLVSSGDLPFPVVEPAQGIRATAVGLSQFSVQVSGSTVALTDALPTRNLPVLQPPVVVTDADDTPGLRQRIQRAARIHELDLRRPVAVPVRWAAAPSYERLRTFAEAIAGVATPSPDEGALFALLLDADLAATLGRLFVEELPLGRPVICLDSIDTERCDFVDLGAPMPNNLVPVVVKALLFGDGSDPASPAASAAGG